MPHAKPNFIELFNGDDLVLDPEHDKFNLVNQIHDEEVNIAMQERGATKSMA